MATLSWQGGQERQTLFWPTVCISLLLWKKGKTNNKVIVLESTRGPFHFIDPVHEQESYLFCLFL